MSDIGNSVYELVKFILETFFEVINDGYELDLSAIILTPGFGEVVWFTIPLDELIIIITTGIVWFTFVYGVWKVVMYIFNLMRGGMSL